MTDRYQINPTYNNIYWIWDYRTPMGKSLFYVKDKETAEFICSYLNQMEDFNEKCIEEIEKLNQRQDGLINENRKIKSTIQTMLMNERTELGKATLRQLWDAIQ